MLRRRSGHARLSAMPGPQPHPVGAYAVQEPAQEVHLLFLNRPPDDDPPDDGGATVVATGSLHHPGLPQPDARRLHDLLVRQPIRSQGALVFLSDLSAELAGQGLSWPQVGIDYEAVTDGLVALYRQGAVPALRLTQLSGLAITLLASGPHVDVYALPPEGGAPEPLDPVILQARREELRAMIHADLTATLANGSSL